MQTHSVNQHCVQVISLTTIQDTNQPTTLDYVSHCTSAYEGHFTMSFKRKQLPRQ